MLELKNGDKKAPGYDFSIIIVNWNTREILVQCIQSILEHTRKPAFEIIVVDNASSDGSVTAVKQFFPSVKVICNDRNLGFARANNIGIRQSLGRYVCLVNSDILFFNDAFSQMLAFMDTQPDIGILSPRLLNRNLTPQRSCRRFPSLWKSFCSAVGLDKLFPGSRIFGGESLKIPNTTQPVEVSAGAFWMVRRDALNQVGLLDERFFFYSEDVDWCKRFWQKDWQVVYYPEAQVIHYEGMSSGVASVNYYIEFRRSRWKYWRKHHGKVSQLLFWQIIFCHQMIRFIGFTMQLLYRPADKGLVWIKVKRSFKCIRWLFQLP